MKKPLLLSFLLILFLCHVSFAIQPETRSFGLNQTVRIWYEYTDIVQEKQIVDNCTYYANFTCFSWANVTYWINTYIYDVTEPMIKKIYYDDSGNVEKVDFSFDIKRNAITIMLLDPKMTAKDFNTKYRYKGKEITDKDYDDFKAELLDYPLIIKDGFISQSPIKENIMAKDRITMDITAIPVGWDRMAKFKLGYDSVNWTVDSQSDWTSYASDYVGIDKDSHVGKIMIGLTDQEDYSKLVAFWRSESVNRNSTHVLDVSGQNNHALLSGISYVGDAFRGSASPYFDGTGYMTIADSSNLDFTQTTIEMWVYFTVTPDSWDYMIMREQAGSTNELWKIGVDDQSPKHFSCGATISGVWKGVLSTTIISTGTWYHVAMTYDGSNLRLYINGGLEDTEAGSSSIDSSTKAITIGRKTAGGYVFTGYLDDIRILNDDCTSCFGYFNTGNWISTFYDFSENVNFSFMNITMSNCTTGSGLVTVDIYTQSSNDGVNVLQTDTTTNYCFNGATEISLNELGANARYVRVNMTLEATQYYMTPRIDGFVLMSDYAPPTYYAPTISTFSDTPDPQVPPNAVQFSVSWSDTDTDTTRFFVCKTNSLNSGNDSCVSGQDWCLNSTLNSESPKYCSYYVQYGDSGVNTYYVFVCQNTDGQGGSLCSAKSGNSGTFTVNVTHAPAIQSYSDTPDPLIYGNTITFSVDWTDADAGETAKIFICKTNSLSSNSSCTAGAWCYSSTFETTDPRTCNYVTQVTDVGINNYHVFVCDSAGLCTANPSEHSSTFTVMSPPAQNVTRVVLSSNPASVNASCVNYSTITVTAYNSTGTCAGTWTFNTSTSLGNLSASSCSTGGGYSCQVTISSCAVGNATVTATQNINVSVTNSTIIQFTVYYPPPDPGQHNITLGIVEPSYTYQKIHGSFNFTCNISVNTNSSNATGRLWLMIDGGYLNISTIFNQTHLNTLNGLGWSSYRLLFSTESVFEDDYGRHSVDCFYIFDDMTGNVSANEYFVYEPYGLDIPDILDETGELNLIGKALSWFGDNFGLNLVGALYMFAIIFISITTLVVAVATRDTAPTVIMFVGGILGFTLFGWLPFWMAVVLIVTSALVMASKVSSFIGGLRGG